ncbi:MAG TPA: sugar ABC transporter permease [Thermoanaerobaculia bacterium]|nr:sugar ABC transporter permease [Thermoanaerobaculia bacterium]
MAGLRSDRRFAWGLVSPALAVVALVALFPLGWNFWESLHRHDLRMPWLGRPFVGLANYGELLADRRFWESMGHTALFTAASVSLEMALGLAFALALDRSFRLRGAARAAALIPWALPTVVAGLIWRFLFDPQAGIAGGGWLTGPATAWVPVVLADVWKSTPFVALLLLAGLQGIDPALHEAAVVDGAGPWRRLWRITLPLLKPALLVALVFRTLDAFRVFDLLYVLTGGGPGTATEPVSLYAFDVYFSSLRFGYGAALSVAVFLATFLLAVLYVRGLRVDLKEEG